MQISPPAQPRVTSEGRFLDWIERVGNRLPDPTMHFAIALAITMLASAFVAGRDLGLIDPRTGRPLEVISQLSPAGVTGILTGMVPAYVAFPPLGIVLVMVIGVGVAEHSGLVGAALQRLMAVTPVAWLTPVVAAAGVLGHALGDAGLLVLAHSSRRSSSPCS